jgi:hypothetical protein
VLTVADQTITETTLAGGRIHYELGRPNWEDGRLPDIREPGSTVQIPEDRLIDVVILGDGFTTAADFRAALVDWLAEFYTLTVYERFAGAFRIRALYTPSMEAASTDRDSYYGCSVNDDETGISKDDDWWLSNDAKGVRFRHRLWEGVDSFTDVNLRRYSAQLDLGSNLAIGNWLRDIYRNLVVSMLVRTAATPNVSGMARDVPREPPDQARRARVAFGANTIHEFSHAFGLLSDEYIDGRGTQSTRSNPTTPSVFTLSNLSYSNRDDAVPWLHLAPTGRFRRTAGGNEPSPLAGWLWVGGVKHMGVWHAEYHCLMNGKHDNFAFTQVASNDPTANPDGTYTDENGAALRDGDRFCEWCQEVVVLRILEKTDRLVRSDDPSDPTEQGQAWYARWVEELRANYFALLGVEQQVLDAEARYAALNPGRNGEPLWQSDLYSVPRASSTQVSSPVPGLADDESYLMLGYAAIP